MSDSINQNKLNYWPWIYLADFVVVMGWISNKDYSRNSNAQLPVQVCIYLDSEFAFYDKELCEFGLHPGSAFASKPYDDVLEYTAHRLMCRPPTPEVYGSSHNGSTPLSH